MNGLSSMSWRCRRTAEAGEAVTWSAYAYHLISAVSPVTPQSPAPEPYKVKSPKRHRVILN